MMEPATTPGASVVGNLTEIPPWEAELILSMRVWMDSPQGQAKVRDGFARCFGVVRGHAELHNFETLLSGLCNHARRPLVRHGLGCTCIGSDEAVLQTLVREAASGDLTEAALIASLVVPACYAEPIALMAAQVGQAMQCMARETPVPNPDPIRPDNRILH